ncbi:MAG: hypothetical protein RSD88_04345 [Anaerovoracaceae bacterium]
MIKIYLTGVPSLYEGEDIEIRYSLFKDGIQINKERMLRYYMKPALVGLQSVIHLLGEIGQYKNEEIEVIINDPALLELINGTNGTKKEEVLTMARVVNKQLKKFSNLSFVNVTKNKEALMEWKERTKA